MGTQLLLIDPVGFRKKRGIVRSESAIHDFCSCLTSCNLKDLGCSGCVYTWNNRRDGVNFVEKQLDRFCGSYDWFSMVGKWKVDNLVTFGSDHAPIL